MVDCKACVMKGRGRRPPHANCCEKGKQEKKKMYKQGYNAIPYDKLYSQLYKGSKLNLPKLKGKPYAYKNGLQNKIKEVNQNVQNNKDKNVVQQIPKLKHVLKPYLNDLLKPKNIEKIKKQTLNNKNNKQINYLLKTFVNKQKVDSWFKTISFKFRKNIYKRPKSITLYLKRNGSVNPQSEYHDVNDLKHYSKKVKKAHETNKRFIITKLHLLFDINDNKGKSPSNENWEHSFGYHMNILVHDLQKNRIFRVEPHGSCSDVTNKQLDKYIKSILKIKKVKYTRLNDFLPFKGPMYYYGPSYWTSAIWCLAFMHYILQFPNMSTNNIFKQLGLRKKTSKDFMRKYIKYLLSQDKLKQAFKE